MPINIYYHKSIVQMITENKLNKIIHKVILKEFMQPNFSFEKLNTLNPTEQLEYCMEYLGEPVNYKGSSRLVFEIDDYQVLKLAYGKQLQAGVDQNKEEWRFTQNVKSPIVTKVYYHADDWRWIVSERVLPCEDNDLFKVLGIARFRDGSEDTLEGYIANENPSTSGYSQYRIQPINTNGGYRMGFEDLRLVIKYLVEGADYNWIDEHYPCELYRIQTHPWFNELFNLCKNHKLDIYDMTINNLGLTVRNGKPTIVILDSGLSEEIAEKYY